MTGRLHRWAALNATVMLGLGLASACLSQPQEPVSYDEFLEGSPGTADRPPSSRDSTWTVEPGPDGRLQPAERARPSREEPDDPELQHILSQQRARAAAEASDPDFDIAAFLRSDRGSPPPAPPPASQRLVTIVSAAMVAMIGALAGIGVALLRARYGKPADPARRIRFLR